MKRDRSWIVSLRFTPEWTFAKWEVMFSCRNDDIKHIRYGRTPFLALLKAARCRRQIIEMRTTAKLTA